MIEVIAGCMFSGKSEELTRRLRRAEIAGLKILAYKPESDDRYHDSMISSHSNIKYSAKTFKNFIELKSIIKDDLSASKHPPNIIAIDEVQFLPEEFVQFVEDLAYNGFRVILSGLDQDYMGRPFGPMPNLMAIADKIDKVTAICVAKNKNGEICGKPATKSFRIPTYDTGSVIQIGAANTYEARCRHCWSKNN